MDTLIIHITPDFREQVSWCLMTATSEDRVVKKTTLQELSQAAHGCFVIALVPSESTMLVNIELPTVSASKRRQAIPFALESQLVDSIDTLHFATIESNASDIWPIAVTANKLMADWIETFKKEHIKIDCMMPDIFGLPYTPNQWQIFADEQRALIRFGQYRGVTTDIENLNLTLEKLCEQQSTELPEKINLYEAYAKSESIKIPAGIDSDTHQCSNLLQIIPAPKPSGIDLLQDKFKAKSSRAGKFRLWSIAASILILYIFVLIVGHLVHYFELSHELNKTNKAISKIYYQVFPNSPSVIAPKLRMQQIIKGDSKAAGSNFLSLLEKAGYVYSRAGNFTIKNMSYKNNTLTLSITTAGFSQLQQILHLLKAQNISVSQQQAHSLSQKDTTVSASLILSTKGK